LQGVRFGCLIDAAAGKRTEGMTNSRLLELWGAALLEAARGSRAPQAFFDIFQNGYATKTEKAGQAYKRFAEVCREAFGREGIEAFNGVMQEFYRNVGVVPRKQYNDLKAEYDQLQERVRDMESKLQELRNRLETGGTTSADLMTQWMNVARNYADLNQKFLEEFGKMFAVDTSRDSQE
jgi:hypothetical protein